MKPLVDVKVNADHQWQLVGCVDFYNLNQIQQKLRKLMVEQFPTAITFEKLTHFDSALVALMVFLKREAHQRGLSFKFLHVPEKVKTIMQLYGVDELLTNCNI